jgi:hypothetical protein
MIHWHTSLHDIPRPIQLRFRWILDPIQRAITRNRRIPPLNPPLRIIDAKRAPDVKIPPDFTQIPICAALHKRHVPFIKARKAGLNIVQGVRPIRHRHDAAYLKEVE